MKLQVSEDIVEYLIQNMLQNKLTDGTIDVLKFASCLGNREFNLLVLSHLTGTPADEVVRLLWPAVTSGLIAADESQCKVYNDSYVSLML